MSAYVGFEAAIPWNECGDERARCINYNRQSRLIFFLAYTWFTTNSFVDEKLLPHENPVIKIAKFTPCPWILTYVCVSEFECVRTPICNLLSRAANVLIYTNKSIFNRFAVPHFSHSLGYEWMRSFVIR